MNKYTGKKIAIMTDIHGLLEPTIAVLNDIKKRGITSIYSLGDNIGVGPNPSEVLDLLEENNVISIMGNNEEYCILGIEPFISYFDQKKIDSQLWTKSKLSTHHINKLKLYPHSIDLSLGDKKISLCHFANDVRFDYKINSTWSYQYFNDNNLEANKQFLYTNSKRQQEEIEAGIKLDYPYNKGYLSAKDDPLFGGNKPSSYDEIIQGHVHFSLLTEDNGLKVRTIRALGMGYNDDPYNSASYVILKEKEVGYDVEEVLVSYDRNKMIESILNSDMPDKDLISKFVHLEKTKKR